MDKKTKKKKEKEKRSIRKAGAAERRKGVDNINQKHSIFDHKTSKRNKTRQTKNDKAIDEGLK